MPDLFFPQGLALKGNFCNRTQEQERLKNNLLSARPTLVISPRRYGKTSLVLNVLHQLKLPYSAIDLYAELNDIEIQNTVLSAIGDILYAVESAPKKALAVVADFFSDFSVNFKFVDSHVRIEFSRTQKSPAKTILEALKKLDATLKKKNKKAILFFDEFQRVHQISENATLEGSLRHVAQESQNIAFVFSGSNRHLLSQMFDDRSQPLYKLCDRVVIERISEEHYLPFIQQKAHDRWKKYLDPTIINTILELTEKHPYYVNTLCHRLWLLDKPPSKKEEKLIHSVWHQYALEEKSTVMNELELLSTNQAKLLMAMAKYSIGTSPMSKEFLSLTGFSSSSTAQSAKILLQKDYLYRQDNKLFILDPLIKYLFAETV